MDLLRFTTAGNVDDGKSTLIGRLLYDTHAIKDDQMEGLREASSRLGDSQLNLALVTDGLKAEREQGITIDVAYRYFSTPKRKFIIADTPGHFQYTRNMVTGASTANLAIILIDARKGLVEQTRRHCFIASLLRIPHLVICVNKMDLVGYSEDVFNSIRDDFSEFSQKIAIQDVTFIPMSALVGDNVVSNTDAMPWYQGRSLLRHLEDVHIGSDLNYIDCRFVVQTTIRNNDYRGYAGYLASGTLREGDDVVVLPSGFASKVRNIRILDKSFDEARAPMSVLIQLEDEIDVARGNMLVRTANRPTVSQDFDAMICWFDQQSFTQGNRYILMHAANEARCLVKSIQYKVDINTMHRNTESKVLSTNEIAKVSIHTSKPVLFDVYQRNRTTGSSILIDEVSNSTVASGIIV